MPVKNAALFLNETLASLQNQDYEHWELLAVNDHSTDNSWTLLQQAAALDPRIKLWPNPTKGILPALQWAFAQSKGRFVGRLDADDLLPPQRLSLMTSALSQKKSKTVVTGKVQYFGASPISSGYQKYETWLNQNLQSVNPWRQVYRECLVASPNWLMYRSALIEIGGFTGLVYPEDYDLVFRWYQCGFTLHGLPEITLLWREHPARTSRHSEHYQQAAFFKLKLMRFLALKQPIDNLVVWGTTVKGKLTAQILLAQKVPFRWMCLQPEKHAQGLMGKTILDFKELAQLPKAKVLLAVYPPLQQRLKIEVYLNHLQLFEGADWWYL